MLTRYTLSHLLEHSSNFVPIGGKHNVHHDVPEHIQYKLGTIVYRCLQNKAPSYLVAACTLVADVTSRQHLCSASRHQPVVPRHRCTTLGRRAFSVAGPMACNALPDDVQDPALGCSTFQRVLKTFLFSKY